MSVSYLGLTREAGETGVAQVGWQDWYRYFPWKTGARRARAAGRGHRAAAGRLVRGGRGSASRARRRQRADITFGLNGAAWNEDMVLQRYELLFEAGLVPEAARRGAVGARPCPASPCVMTIVASWPPASRGCAPRSSTGPSCSS